MERRGCYFSQVFIFISTAILLSAPSQAPTDGCLVATVFFETGTANLDRQATDVLDRGLNDGLREALTAGARLNIAGGTDDRGSDSFNLALSHRRAAAVRDYYLRHGLSEDQLVIVALGETRPIVGPENQTEAARAQNRYVQVSTEMSRETFDRLHPTIMC